MPLQGGGQPFPEQLIRHRKTRHQPHQPSIGSEIGNACAHGCGSAIGRTILFWVAHASSEGEPAANQPYRGFDMRALLARECGDDVPPLPPREFHDSGVATSTAAP